MLAPQKVVTDQTIGSTVTEQAIDIDGYTVVEVDTQALTIKQSKTGKWTFTGWCSDAACTQPITEITNISTDTTVYGKWVYSETENNNEITFYYEEPAVQYVSYTVRYIDMGTNELLLEDELRQDIVAGTTVTEVYVPIEGYTVLCPEITFEVVGNEVVIFMYYEGYEPID